MTRPRQSPRCAPGPDPTTAARRRLRSAAHRNAAPSAPRRAAQPLHAARPDRPRGDHRTVGQRPAGRPRRRRDAPRPGPRVAADDAPRRLPGRVASLRIRHGHVQQPASPRGERNPCLPLKRPAAKCAAPLKGRARRGHVPAETGRGHGIADRRHCQRRVRTGPLRGPATSRVLVSHPSYPAASTLDPCAARADPATVRRSVETPRPRTSLRRWSSAQSGGEPAPRVDLGAPRRTNEAATPRAARSPIAGGRSWLATPAPSSSSTAAARAACSPASRGSRCGFPARSALLTDGHQLSGLLSSNWSASRRRDDNADAELASLRPPTRTSRPAGRRRRGRHQVAVSVLQARGEPASAERLLARSHRA